MDRAKASVTQDLLDPVAAARFWASLDLADDNPASCWTWAGNYGWEEPTGHVRIHHQGVKIYVHRLALLLSGTVIPDGAVVRHTCDNPPCANPRHCLLGTQADNIADREARARRTPFLPRGDQHWSAKLTAIDAARIRAARGLGLRAQDLAVLFGISRSTVYAIWSGTTYADSLAAGRDAVRAA